MPSRPLQTTTDNHGTRQHSAFDCLRKIALACHYGTASCLDNDTMPSQAMQRVTMIRGSLLITLFLACFTALIFHVYNLQVNQHDYYLSRAEKQASATISTEGAYGSIRDYDGALLVGNLTNASVLLEPKRILPENLDRVANLLAEILDIPASTIVDKCLRIVNAPIAVHLDCDLLPCNAQIISLWNLPALTVEPPTREDNDYQLVIYPKSCSSEELQNTLEQLSPLVNRTPKQLLEQVNKAINRPKEVTVFNGVELETGETLKRRLAELEQQIAADEKQNKSKIHQGKLPVRLTEGNARCYPQGAMMANVLGFLSNDPQNPQYSSGVEALFSNYMKPIKGTASYQKDTSGKRISDNPKQVTPAQNGADVFLTLQAPLQYIVEEELDKMIDKYQPHRAYAIMMNPRTGAIMAMAHYPSFNPNDRNTMKDGNAIQLHSLSHIYEPGSIMKCLPVSYALDHGIVKLDSVYFCEHGRWHYAGHPLNDTHHNEHLTVSDIIAVSSNIGTAKIALDMGDEQLYRALKGFGFGEKTKLGFLPPEGDPIAFRGETVGLFAPLAKWRKITPTRVCIGQGISCTPLQLLRAYGAIANGGTMMHPYIVDRIVMGNGDVIRSVPRVFGHPIGPHGAREIIKAMYEVVNNRQGTGTKAALPDTIVVGKTGSAQVWNHSTHQYEKHIFNSSFVGFAPMDNPAFVMIVSAIHVPYHGGTVCGPVFREVAKRTLEHLNITPEPIATPKNTVTSTH